MALELPIRHSKSFTKMLRHNRLALSSVVTTLIILVISVLLASVVTYFAINVTSTRVQEESVVLAKQHVWYDAASATSEAAIMVINTGGRDVVIDRLTVRGQECAWAKVFYTTTTDSLSKDLFYNSTLIDGGSIKIGGTGYVFKQASNDITLQSGKTLIIYLSNPDSISVSDVGLTVSVNIFTSQAMYYKETNVQGSAETTPQSTSTPTSSPAPTSAPSGVDVTLSNVHVWYDTSGHVAQIGFVMKNTGGEDVRFFEISNMIAWGLTYYYTGTFTLESPLTYMPTIDDGSATPLGADKTFTVMLDFPVLHPGQSMIVYTTHCIGIGASDIGESVQVDVTLNPGQEIFSETTIVEGVS
jgi:hypothetical protein